MAKGIFTVTAAVTTFIIFSNVVLLFLQRFVFVGEWLRIVTAHELILTTITGLPVPEAAGGLGLFECGLVLQKT